VLTNPTGDAPEPDQAASMLDRERWVKELGTTLAGVLG
jgi:hypothetical protein